VHRILWVATKPPAPPTDGGRLVALETLRALAAAGHVITVVAPAAPGTADDARRAAASFDVALEAVETSPRSWTTAAVAALVRGLPATIVRHDHPALAARVDALLSARTFDVVHAEQLQAFTASAPARRHGVPVVLRTQNVESEVWTHRAAAGGAFRFEAGRLARFEARAVRAAARTVALTARDADRLRALAGGGARVVHVPAPFVATLPAGEPLPGAPAVVAPASAGWAPNDDARAWLVDAVWPAVARAVPGARLHLFGGPPAASTVASVTRHPAAADSREIFAANAIALVALRAPAGVRMRILEAWARGVPVVATTAAVAGLDGGADAVVTADHPSGIAAAIGALAADPARIAALVAAGAATLRERHDPARIANALGAVYAEAVHAARC
jgi:hypothetical protein